MSCGTDTRSYTRAVFLGSWLIAVFASFITLWVYEKKPSSVVSDDVVTWPQNDLIACDPNRPTVVMFAHPKCPCTRASLNELAKFANNDHDASISIVFFVPSDADDSWHETVNTDLASKISGATAVWDHEGSIARRFGMNVSGQCVAFSPQKKLLYSGGITVSRGHEGDNLGAAALAQCLTTPQQEPKTYPVYGCSLFAFPR